VDLRLTLGYWQICSKLKKCATPGKLAKIPGGTPGYMALKSTKTTTSGEFTTLQKQLTAYRGRNNCLHAPFPFPFSFISGDYCENVGHILGFFLLYRAHSKKGHNFKTWKKIN
jgi:hypothetical protein